MRISAMFIPTMRETPADADIMSYQLMVRSGILRKVATGLYSCLPLGMRTINKISRILREEMNAAGAQEIMMPALQSAELLRETGRWEARGEELLRLRDRSNREVYLAPGHEEAVTALMRTDIRSYRQLPMALYQIRKVFRDEARPHLGLIRSREFLMKELFTFDRDTNGLAVSYQRMFDVYGRIFARLGLKCMAIQASSETPEEGESHEFVVLAAAGETEVCLCKGCGYAADREHAALVAVLAEPELLKQLELVNTPDCKTMEEVAQFLGFKPEHAIKTLAFITDKGSVLALVRGDHEVNETKVKSLLGCRSLAMADAGTIEQMGSSPGYIGPIGIKNTTVIADHTVMNMVNTECGGNQLDCHYINVNPGRDFKPDWIADIRLMKKGDPCPNCSAPVEFERGIEVGRLRKLGTRYSELLSLGFKDEDGTEKPVVMGCYGMGLERSMAAVVELSHDESGIIWPAAIAPFEAVIVPVSIAEETQREQAEKIYRELTAAGVDVVLDDRNERVGSKFVDADLIGYPVRVTIGPKTIKNKVIEVKIRRSGEVKFLKADEYVNEIKIILQERLE